MTWAGIKPAWPFKKDDRVRVFNGGEFEGWAVIVDHASTPDDYHVRFQEDIDRSIWRRTVLPEWQEQVGDIYELEVDEKTAAEIQAFSEGRRS